MKDTGQTPLRLQLPPDASTVEMLHQLFGDVLIPLEKLRVHYFKNLNEKTFTEAVNSGRIQLPVITLDHSVKALRYAHIKHVAALIDARAYKADEEMPRPQNDSTEQVQ
ncbi:transcriptional regulator [Pseudomonas kairouanensis]|uniref:Transcriptional regulator n=1 Tax=Pseudomonas kairouanensis TaxID=2293832 RepID=A0A4Z0B2K8_9PSED|nr:pyocin activator PrtN family protein [Pseudomonas kairouanensis]TFY92777.1 transcriptional regulator [Pseudomonas kairouanensis]